MALHIACWVPPQVQPACQIAVDGFNATTGGIMGVKAEVLAMDDRGDAASLAQKLIADRTVLGVVGPMDSGSTLRAGPALDAARLGFVSPSARSSKITESGWRTAHRLVARDDLEGPADAIFLFGPPVYAKNVYVVDSQDLDSIGLADEFEKRAKALGIKTERDSLPPMDDYSAEITKVKAAKPDVLFFPDGGSKCALLPPEIGKQSAPFKFMSTAGCHGATAEGMFVSAADTTPQGQAWARDYKAKVGADPAPFAANAYDAAEIILQAVQSATTAKGSLDVKPADVNAELGKTNGYKGVARPISLDAKGDVMNPAVSIYQVTGGTFKKLAP